MGAEREGADLFGNLRICGRWNWKIFKSPYFWHDSFGIRLARFVGCEHKAAMFLDPENGMIEKYCFDCHTVVDKMKYTKNVPGCHEEN